MKKGITFLITLLFIGYGFSQQEFSKYYTGENGIAIGGYDVVNYHTDNSAKQGNADFSYKYDGATFQFANKKNLKVFKKNPEKYLPEYNGYCAFGVGKASKKFPIDPKSFKIKDGKLYLFFVGPIRGKVTNTLDIWNKNEAQLLERADKAWVQMQKNN